MAVPNGPPRSRGVVVGAIVAVPGVAVPNGPPRSNGVAVGVEVFPGVAVSKASPKSRGVAVGVVTFPGAGVSASCMGVAVGAGASVMAGDMASSGVDVGSGVVGDGVPGGSS